MVVRIHKPTKETRAGNNNQGSSEAVIDYLDKENVGKPLAEKEFFFNNKTDAIGSNKVIDMLDNNKKGLRKTDAKFYMITINPSAKELDYIGNDINKLKSYTHSVMEEYAAGFNRLNANGEKLNADDLLYFAKVEKNRTYKINDNNYTDTYQKNSAISKEIRVLKESMATSTSEDQQVIQNNIDKLQARLIRNTDGVIIKPGAKKDGLNTHIHVIVSRKDITQKISLSPFANAKGGKNTLNGRKVDIGFNRGEFIKHCEKGFDNSFSYPRTPKETIFSLRDVSLNPQSMVKNMVLRVIDKDNILRNKINMIQSVKNPLNAVINNVTAELANKVISGAIPTKIPVDLIKRSVTKSISMILKAAEIGF